MLFSREKERKGGGGEYSLGAWAGRRFLLREGAGKEKAREVE